MNKPRILTPSGLILRHLLRSKVGSPKNIGDSERIALSTIYFNLKELNLLGYLSKTNDAYRITSAGARAYLSEVLPDVNADFIIELGSRASFSPLKVIELGVRVLQAIDEASYLPADLVRLLARYDPSLLENLQELFGSRSGGAGPNQVAEVVA